MCTQKSYHEPEKRLRFQLVWDVHLTFKLSDSTSLLCEEHVGKDAGQPYFGETAKGQKENRKGVQEETEREKRVQEQRKEIEEKVAEQQLQVVAASNERKREGEDLDGGKPSSFFSLEDEEEPDVPRAESGCPIGLLAVCDQEEFFSSGLPTDSSSPVAPPFCPMRIQQPRPQKRPHSGSPTSEAPPLLPLESTEPNPPAKLPPKVVSLGDFPPLQVKFTQVYTTRRYTRYTARGQGAFLQYPGVGEGSEALRLEEPADPALMPPKPKKKMRTLYTTDQLEELERLFQDDHYPDSDKRKEIAVAIGVTPQRIMVWFQNRRAKWRKVEKTSGRQERRQSQEGRGHLQICAPQARGGLPTVQASRLTPQTSQALPHYNTILPNCPSPTGVAVGGDVGQQSLTATGPPGPAVDHLPPVMLSPPPLRRASLPLLTSYNPPNHLAPLLLDTPDSSFTTPHPDSAGKESQGTSSSLFDYSETMGNTVKVDTQHYLHSGHQGGALSYQLNPYPQQHSSLLPASSLGQYSRLSYLAPSSSLAPTPPDSNPPSYLTFGTGGSAGVVTYTAGGQAYFQSQSGSQFLLQSGVHGGISAFQACPWSDVYGQTSQFPPTVYHRAQYAPGGAAGLASAQHYIQMQRPGAGPGQTVFQPVQRGPVGPVASLQLPPTSTLRPQYQNPERADRTLQSTKMGHDPAGVAVKSEYDPTPEPNQSQPPDPRTTESDTAFSCDFSPINF
ncbi:uncharacterized protein LOC118233775 isoform X1 [Anguilla anguilla]|uniref:uncharacterized protein LOC118233775 isoform X1 n=1 Tax=Anguilla anguilla TaxID=7936 RepID=UPI0015B26420|nr:uncharacterized protein LOC118233775 isoform X1 [Anguilla anguilla]